LNSPKPLKTWKKKDKNRARLHIAIICQQFKKKQIKSGRERRGEYVITHISMRVFLFPFDKLP